MPGKNIEIDGLKIFTLNCWGLRYISDHRQDRIKLIAQHLVDQEYDVVFLQEVWIQSDFEYLRTKTKYRFAHIFNNASLLGTSGLVILAKWIPKLVHFHPFSINGSPFRPFHGDWFSTKGVAYVRIELVGLNLHLFSTHMHAQYDIKEKIMDQYSVHRICQAYELGKFINLMSFNCPSAAYKDLIILAGDMNASSKELPYRLLREITDLNDCYKLLQREPFRSAFNHNHKNIRKLRIQELKDNDNDEQSSDEELITCGHRDNTFTPREDLNAPKTGKRIDFIFYKLRDCCSSDTTTATHRSNKTNNNEIINLLKTNESNHNENPAQQFLQCIPEKLTVVAKDVSGLSFSDHQPVAAKLLLKWTAAQPEMCHEEKSLSLVESKNGDNCHNNLMTSKFVKRQRYAVCNQPIYKKWKDSPLLQEIEELLQTYIEKFKPSIKYSIIITTIITIMFTIFLGFLKFHIHLTWTEVFLIGTIFFIIAFVGLLLKFITHRTEINAIKAILNDIHNKRTFHPDYALANDLTECND